MKNNFGFANLRQSWFLWLLPVFFVFHGYVENYPLVPVIDSIELLLFYEVVCVLMIALFYWVFRSWAKAGLFFFFLLSTHFFFGAVHDAIKKIFGDVLFTRYVFLLPAIAILTLIVFLSLKIKPSISDRLTKYFTLLLVLSLSFDAFGLLRKTVRDDQIKTSLPIGSPACDTCKMPDVFFIVADEYPGEKALNDIFQFDNTAFGQSLSTLGFHVIGQSKSNYNFTPFSIASTLNMDYLPLKDPSHTMGDVPLVMTMIGENKVTGIFKEHGYQIVNNSVFDLPGEPKQVSSSFLPYKLKYITAQTLFSRLERDLYYHLITSLKIKSVVEKSLYHNYRTNQKVYRSTMEEVQKISGPRFIYTHLSMPHPPYYFNENGQPNPTDSLSSNSANIYLGYLKYTNKKLIYLLKYIVKNNPSPPVIFLISDHGFRDNKVEYYFDNVMGVYLPDGAYKPYYNGLSSVNLFRIFFNQYYKKELPLLKDSTVLLRD